MLLYDVGMDVFEVVPTSEARANLSPTLDRFRHDGLVATPVIFGSHRKPEGVVLPYALFERLLPAIDDVLLAETVRARINSDAESIPLSDVIEELGFTPDEFGI